MRSCEEFEVDISLKLDGMLEPEEEQALEEHLAHCPGCRQLARELEQLHAALPQLEELSAPDRFAEDVMGRIRALESKPKVVPLFKRPQFKAVLGLAACVVLCIGLYQGGPGGQNAGAPGTNTALYWGGEDQEMSGGAEPGEVQKETRTDPGTPQPADIGTENVPQGIAGEGYAFSNHQVGGQSVAAVLTLERLPQGTEQVWDEKPEWQIDSEGHSYCMIVGTQLEELKELAESQGIASTLEGGADEVQICALVLLETP